MASSWIRSRAAVIFQGEDGVRDIVTVSLNTAGDQLVVDWEQPDLGLSGSSSFPVATTPSLTVNTFGGDDDLIVDNSAGLVDLSNGIQFNGGNGWDRLILTGGTPVDTETYDVGPAVDEGRVTLGVVDGGTQTITFTGLEPVQSNVVAANVVINATDSDNAINYTQGPGGGIFGGDTTGLVTVDGFESYEFSQKAALTINGRSGDDVIHLNHPGTPTGLADITVDGGDPTGSDTVIVNGSAAADAIVFSSTAADAATIMGVQGVAQVAITAAEAVVINGQGGNDELTVQTPAGETAFATIAGGSVEGSGSIQLTGLTQDLLGASFRNLGVGGSIVMDDGDAVADDRLTMVGTASDNFFVLDATAGTVTSNVVIQVDVTDVARMLIEGLGGNDAIVISGSSATLLPGGLEVLGGDSDAFTDSLGVTASVVDAVFDPVSGSVTLNGVLAGGITAGGVERVALAGTDGTADAYTVTGYGASSSVKQLVIDGGDADNDDGDTIAVAMTDGPSRVSFTPTSMMSATLDAAGAPTIVIAGFNNAAGNLSVDGGGSLDTLRMIGSAGADTIDIDAVTMALTVDGDAWTPITIAAFEALSAEGGQGADMFNVTPDAVPVTILGGTPIGILQGTGDILNVITGGAAFAYQQGPEGDSGAVTVDGLAPVSFDEIELLEIDGIPYILPDAFEPNDSIPGATILGSLPKLTLRDLTLHDEGAGVINEDYFQITATDSGRLIFNLYALVGAGLGDVDFEIRDSGDNLIATAAEVGVGQDQLVIPVVTQEVYFVHVFSADALPNEYVLEIENFAAPVPNAIDLAAADDSGMSDMDDVTYQPEGTITIEADLTEFEASGVAILSAADVAAGDIPGAAVEVFVDGVSVGFADQIGGTNFDLFSYTFAPGDLPEGTSLVKAAVRMIDGQTPNASGRTQLSEPRLIVLDTIAPDPSAPTLAPYSDSGVLGDNITSVNPPAFVGVAEVNAKIHVFADGVLVGTGFVQSDDTDGDPDNGLGIWEITVEPLADGDYEITTIVEDLAGNLSLPLETPLEITVDAAEPQRPTIDLVNTDDTGWSDLDNVTIGDPDVAKDPEADFRISAELDSTVVVKDGETHIDTFVFDAAFDMTDGVMDGFGILRVDFAANETNFGIPAEGPHPLSVEATDDAGNFTQSEQLLVEIDSTSPDPATIALADYSDSGIVGDGITSISQPAFLGLAEANAKIHILALRTDLPNATPEFVGTGIRPVGRE